MNGSKTASLALLVLALVAGCGTSDPGAPPPSGTPDAGNDSGGNDDADNCQLPTGDLLPWKVGHKWTYTVTEAGMVSQKVTTIEALEMVAGSGPNAGKMANKVVTKKGMMDQTISWQALIGTKVVRYREQAYGAVSGLLELEEHWDPHKIHIDWTPENMVERKTWVETYKETKLAVGLPSSTSTAMDAWMVEKQCEAVEVLGQTYRAVRFAKASGSARKLYWYVPGIGKVKETGTQTEELVKFEAAP